MKCQRSAFILAAFLEFATLRAAAGQVYQELYSFAPFGLDGANPRGEMVQSKNGNLYGTTMNGGSWGYGTAFRVTPDGLLTSLASFNATNNAQHPMGALIEMTDGDVYGTTIPPSAVFKMAPAGVLTLFGYTLSETVLDACAGSDGYLYFVSNDGAGDGRIFRGPVGGGSGELLFQFRYERPENGRFPSSGLIHASDGKFYGVTSGGGAYDYGVVYQITTNGTYTVMSSFGAGTNAMDAVKPYGRLLQASDGNFYGVASGGRTGEGTIFKMTSDGTLATLAQFDCYTGKNPNGGLIEGNDGSFYGTAPYCGAGSGTYYNLGTVFKMTPGGALTALFAFKGGAGPYSGANPYSGLVQGTDGNLYGTTGNQGSRGAGNVFRITMPGPVLNATRAHRHIVLSWRTNYVGFTLQYSTNLAAANWIECTNSPSIAEGQFVVTNSISGAREFFRLKK